MRYVYPAVFTPAEDLEGYYVVTFPDIAGATQGKDLYEALTMAEEALELMMSGIESRGEKAPTPTPLKKIRLSQDAFISFIKADTDKKISA